MARVRGAEVFRRRLQNIRTSTPNLVLRALYAAGQLIELHAERSITEGSISGKGHIPSSPGEPPNADTRLLDTSIETTIASTNPPRVEVTSNAPYSAALEYGTSKMAERPFMRPASAAQRVNARRLVEEAIRRATRRR